jgi:ParB family chromosome partitioning protein
LARREEIGLADVPVIVRQASDREVLELALIENLQREGLNPIEEASAYSRLHVEFGLTQEEISRQVGKSRASVANAMRLLDLRKMPNRSSSTDASLWGTPKSFFP